MRRRGKAEIREAKLREAQQKREVEERLAQLEQLEQELRTAQAKAQRSEDLASTAEQMIAAGVLRHDGNN